jgi:uncharacterized hydrophobic protein (TIGR00271 family)
MRERRGFARTIATVLQLRVYGELWTITRVAKRVDAISGSRHVLVMRNGGPGAGLVTADVGADAADAALAAVRELGVPAEDVELLRLESIGPAAARRPLGGVVWADLLSQAGANARPLARYVVLMATAGVIAAFGVIYDNQILIVGAMAISPDTLPITATCTALVLGRWGLAGRAFATLAVGLTVAGLVAGAMTFALNALGLLSAGFEVGDSAVQGLQTVNISTPIVALAAGVAGMLALETRASSAVGVAISVTTIPASAYLGVAAGVGEEAKALGALLVLAINVAMLIVGGCATLVVQRAYARQMLQAASPRGGDAFLAPRSEHLLDAAGRRGPRKSAGA